MNKKILIGSIIAVAILILVSFTGVVGYQTTKSSTIAKASPLFTVRSSRAIDEESRDLTCEYVGKGEEIVIPLPIKDNRLVLLEKVKDTISKMNREEFNLFKNLITYNLNNINDIGESDITDGNGEQVIPSVFLPFCDKLTASYPIICFLDNLYETILIIVTFIVDIFVVIPLFFLFLLVYDLIFGGLPPTIYFPFC